MVDDHRHLTPFILAFRCIAAMIATGVVSDAVVAIFTVLAMAIFQGELGPGPALVGVFLIAFSGLFIAIPSAIIIGVVFELPKLWLIDQSRDSPSRLVFLASLGASVIGSLIMVIVWYEWTGDGEKLLSVNSLSLFFIPAFVTGGATSAVLWWFLVFKPLRDSGMGEDQLFNPQ